MTYVTIRVTSPQSREVYIDGDYTASAGNSSADTFTVDTGGHIFETLDDRRRVDFRGNIDIGPGLAVVVITLDPVDPPQPIA